jgi:hypothetical protein
VFYRRSNWHTLLKAAREITELHEVRKEVKDVRLFIHTDRGESLRLALKMHPSVDCEASQIITHSINKFLRENPTEARPVVLPINGFFTDFENNSVKYNLFNERLILTCRLAIFQSLISNLLLHFFHEHPVDEDGLFTLVVYLQRGILNGLCTNQKEKIDLLITISKQVKDKGIKLEYEVLLRADHINPNYTREDLQGIGNIETILSKFELAAKAYQKENPGKANNFLIILNIIYQQLGKPDVSIFLEAFQYLFIELKKSSTKSNMLKQTT